MSAKKAKRGRRQEGESFGENNKTVSENRTKDNMEKERGKTPRCPLATKKRPLVQFAEAFSPMRVASKENCHEYGLTVDRLFWRPAAVEMQLDLRLPKNPIRKGAKMDSHLLVDKATGWPLRAIKRFSADRCAPMAASIAFYSAFSLAPTLVMVIAIAGLVFGAEAARGQLFGQISGMLGRDAAASVQAIVEHAHRSDSGGLAAIISFVLLVIGASATFSSLNTALSIIWPAEAETKLGVAALVKVRLVSFGLVMGVAFLLIISLVLDTAIQAAGKFLFGASPLLILSDVAQFVIGLAILSGAMATLLKYLPDGHIPWKDAFVGGAVAAVLFSLGKKLFALYLTHAGTANAFGAAGSLAVLLMWLYFGAVVLLLGAEVSAARIEARRAPTKFRGLSKALSASAQGVEGERLAQRSAALPAEHFLAPPTRESMARAARAVGKKESDVRKELTAIASANRAASGGSSENANAGGSAAATVAESSNSPFVSSQTALPVSSAPRSLRRFVEAAKERPSRIAMAVAGGGLFLALEMASRKAKRAKKGP